jgi:hypothetical protein
LVLYLDAANRKSYPGSGVTWSDLSIGGNIGTLTNGPTYSTENQGYFTFDGTNDYVIGPSISSQLTGDITVEAWIYLTSAAGDWVRIIGTGGTDGTNRTFGLWYSTDRKLLWQRYGAGDPGIFPSTPTMDTGRWHHVAATTNGSIHFLYLNGSVIGSNISASGPWSASGIAVTLAYAGFHTYHNGRISNARIHTRGLSQVEILQNFNATRGRFGI